MWHRNIVMFVKINFLYSMTGAARDGHPATELIESLRKDPFITPELIWQSHWSRKSHQHRTAMNTTNYYLLGFTDWLLSVLDGSYYLKINIYQTCTKDWNMQLCHAWACMWTIYMQLCNPHAWPHVGVSGGTRTTSCSPYQGELKV